MLFKGAQGAFFMGVYFELPAAPPLVLCLQVRLWPPQPRPRRSTCLPWPVGGDLPARLPVPEGGGAVDGLRAARADPGRPVRPQPPAA